MAGLNQVFFYSIFILMLICKSAYAADYYMGSSSPGTGCTEEDKKKFTPIPGTNLVRCEDVYLQLGEKEIKRFNRVDMKAYESKFYKVNAILESGHFNSEVLEATAKESADFLAFADKVISKFSKNTCSQIERDIDNLLRLCATLGCDGKYSKFLPERKGNGDGH